MIVRPAKAGRIGVRYASEAELSALAAPISVRPEAAIVGWHTMRIEAYFEHNVRVLGFVDGGAYITSPIRAVDKARGMIRTRSGNIYALKLRGDDEDMLPVLGRHLARRLAVLGYVEEADVPQRMRSSPVVTLAAKMNTPDLPHATTAWLGKTSR
jgi:hypothetical protein